MLKVGDYVRTKYYGISKILNINNGTTSNYCSIKLDIIDDFGSLGVYVSRDNIIKSSPNIIDLIEVGDYVNEHLVIDKNPNAIYIEDSQNKLAHIPYTKKEIKSIVTKEQFEAIQYEVK